MEIPGEKLIIRLWETLIEKGIGNLLSPWQQKREGRAQLEIRREEILTLAQAQKDAEEIRAGRKTFSNNEGLKTLLIKSGESNNPSLLAKNTTEESELIQQVQKSMLNDMVRKEINVAKTIIIAENVLRDDVHEPPKEKINEDWLYRWREAAGQVSGEELQNMWGRLLAGEVKSPGSFSLRTLDFLRNISTEEAEKIAKLSHYQINGVIVREASDILEEDNISFGYLLEMQQIGIISGAEAMGITSSWFSTEKERFFSIFLSNGKAVIVTHQDPAMEVKISIYKITTIGQQIFNLCPNEPHYKYLRKFASILKSKGFETKLASYSNIQPNLIQYFNTEII